MQTRNYKVNRDNVYVGEVISTDSIYRYEGDDILFRKQVGTLSAKSWTSYRSMLFVPNEDRLADDLLYFSPNYPVLNVTDSNICLDLEGNNIVVKEACNLGEILSYLGFDETLTYEDVIRIKKMVFNPRFGNENSALFGFKEIHANEVDFLQNGEEITDKFRIIASRMKYRVKQKLGKRTFSGIYESPLSPEYWQIIKARSDNSLLSVVLKNAARMNSFAPAREEGLIKKLK